MYPASKSKLYVGVAVVAVLVGLGAQSVYAGSSSSSGSSSSGGSSYQSQYNSYVAQNACGCYSSSAVNQAQSGGNVQSINAQTPGYYSGGGSSGGFGNYTSTAQYYDPSTGGYWSVNNIRQSNGQLVGVADIGGTQYNVTYSTYYTNVYGHDMWTVNNSNTSSSGGSSGGSNGGSGSGSGSGSSSSGGGSSSSGGPSLIGGSGGHYVQQCDSSPWNTGGGANKTCRWVWVSSGGSSGLCETYSCGSSSGGFSSGGGPIPEATVSIDAAPRLVKNGDSTTITWTSANTSSCSITGPNGFSASGTSGSKAAAGVNEQSTYTLVCQSPSGVKQASITVNIVPIWREF